MASLERTYIIPLRKSVNNAPEYKRAKKAITTIREFLSKHMKATDVKIGGVINSLIWERGITNPPGKIKVTATKDAEGVVKAELFGHTYVEKKKVEEKKEKSKLELLKEKMAGKTKAEHNKEAITDVPEHKEKSHVPPDHTKDLKATGVKEQSSTTGKIQAGHKDKK